MDIVRYVLERNGFERLNPVQEAAVGSGVLEGKNVVVSSPTASGKTLIGEMAMVRAIESGKKAVYTCPLRALASEHYEDFSRKYPYKTALSIGDYDSSDPWLAKYETVFTTYEKLDSLIRHGAPWLKDVGVLVVDEIHELDSDRGPTLEVLLTRIIHAYSPQIVALSATIPNAAEIAEWLDAELVYSEWRPVVLREGVCFAKEIVFGDGTTHVVESLQEDDLAALVDETLRMGKQVLIFAMTRRSAEATARRLKSIVSRYVRVKRPLRKIAQEVLGALESPTRQCKELADAVLHGVAFHHAGLVSKQRKVVEDGFRSGNILVVVATPTLAAGVNLPAFRVLFHSLKRFSGFGASYIPVREYKQMAGRAGRPKYDTHGEAIIIARSADEKAGYLDEYVLGTPENIYSRLGTAHALRFHTLALVADGTARSWERLLGFYSKTFYAHQYGNIEMLSEKIREIVLELESYGFVRVDGEKILPTPLGSRVAQLYIDPLSAYKFVRYIQSPKLGELAFLFTISDTTEQYPYLSVSPRMEGELWALAEERKEELPVDPWEVEDPHFLNKFRLALLLEAWINEKTDDEILETFDVSPGVLRAFVSVAEWLSYSMAEIAKLLGEARVWKYAKRMEERIHYGVREELLPLVQLSGIGRVRARKLYNAGYKSVKDLQKADVRDLARILGPKTAKRVKEQLGEKVRMEDLKGVGGEEQTTLDLFIE